MSVRRITGVFDHSKTRLGPRLVMIALADTAKDDGYAWPSGESISKKAGLSHDYIYDIVAELESIGELYVHRIPGKGHTYLVLPGMSPEEIIKAMSFRFKIDEDEAIEWLETHGYGNFREDPGVPESFGVASRNFRGRVPESFLIEPSFNRQLTHIEKIDYINRLSNALEYSKKQLHAEIALASYQEKVIGIEVGGQWEDKVFLVVESDKIAKWNNARLSTTVAKQFTGFLNEKVDVQFVTLDELAKIAEEVEAATVPVLEEA